MAIHQPTKKTSLPKMGATVPSLQKIRIPAKCRLSIAKQAGGLRWWDGARFPQGGEATGKGERLDDSLVEKKEELEIQKGTGRRKVLC